MNTAFIKYRASQLNKSLEQVADDMGVKYQNFSPLINGKTNPTLKTLDKLAEALHCETYQLLKP